METHTIKLVSSDDQVFELPRETAVMSVTLKHMLEDVDDSDIPIPVMGVTADILKKIIDYCNYHLENPDPIIVDDSKKKKKDEKKEDDIIPWDKEFCNVEKPMLFNMILAANYLDIRPLLDLTCKTVANMLKGKTPEEIREEFGIENDLTEEDILKIRKENGWSVDT